MSSETNQVDWRGVQEKAGPYAPQAFQFVRDGLAYTTSLVHGQQNDENTGEHNRHVSGQQLCLGLKDYALRRYGLLAGTVLTRWGINRTDDFGRIVFAMIEGGLMRKADEDSIEDFHNVFAFESAFEIPQSVSRI